MTGRGLKVLVLGVVCWSVLSGVRADQRDRQIVTPVHPRIEIEQRSPKTVTPGQSVPLEIVVRNAGTLRALGVVVTDVLPPGAVLLDATPVPASSGDPLVWALGTLDPGEEKILQMRVGVKPQIGKASLRSVATVSYQTGVTSSFELPVKRPQLVLGVNGPGQGALDEPQLYQLTVGNVGASPARQVMLAVSLPAGLHHMGGKNLEKPIGDLDCGQNITVGLELTPRQAGKLLAKLRAEAENAAPVERELAVEAATVRHHLTMEGPRVVRMGWPCTYNCTVGFRGEQTAAELTVILELPEALKITSSSHDGVYDEKARTLTWKLEGLRREKNRTLVFSGEMTKPGAHRGTALLLHEGTELRRVGWVMQASEEE